MLSSRHSPFGFLPFLWVPASSFASALTVAFHMPPRPVTSMSRYKLLWVQSVRVLYCIRGVVEYIAHHVANAHQIGLVYLVPPESLPQHRPDARAHRFAAVPNLIPSFVSLILLVSQCLIGIRGQQGHAE
ncbi:hypothetical protein LZ30DRAFT_433157 [Colletotrichum cereale]|nr:hypothetical protein LZ30DRAFT_433157 [Colletotrichum cereale]